MDSKTNFQADEHQRRSANYKPNIWNDSFLESLNNKYIGDDYSRQSENLIKDVKNMMFVKTEDLISQLELIDSLGKLGLTNHFEKEIKEALDTVENSNTCITENLYATALHFKILRQHGYKVSQDVFGGFMDEKGALKESNFWDVKGMLELLEASNLTFEGERILDEAKASSTVAVRGSKVWNLDNNLARQLVRALELPSHRRVGWFNVKWHIQAYEKDNHANTILLLELAKLNFNMVQAALQKDLREVSMWWNNLGLKEHLKFARDRPVECFMFAVGLNFHLGYTSFRILLSKVINLILIIDDVYDIYGSLEELKIFTNAVDRWDVGVTEQLPECMKTCFQVLYNTTCEFAHEIEEESSWNLALHHLSKAWADFCKALLVEAEWYSRSYTPSLEEYLSNGCISSSVSVLLVHTFFSTTHRDGIKEIADFLHKNEDLVHNISLIVRLTNDLGTSTAEQERGDAPSAIRCYMQEMNASEDIAERKIKGMIDNAWKKINGTCLRTPQHVPFLSPFINNIATNIARMAHSLYQAGDGFGDQEQGSRLIQSVLVEPLPL
ncbi:PREDICTED: (E,E)-alpha-farnesene synthase-like [Prunus mume]|uniref:(E,E)-alpha-farnesene synthase-like n=1 Tax=Prunus mume TaxID=102107 RepID=A0ABM0NK94_PRUMU|nr:PREDICTED: (E,E)-alpha-farnesene synthase-like [Prunus mume]